MELKKKVAFYTLGCKLNFSETSTIARTFINEGFHRVDFEEVADIYVINTCSVTENADKQFKQVVKKAMKLNDKAFVTAVGCYAQLKPEELAAVDGVDLVLGATEKFKITDYINDLSKNDMGEVHSCEIEEADFDLSINRYKQTDYEEIKYEDPKIILSKIEDLEQEIVDGLKNDGEKESANIYVSFFKILFTK